MAEKVSKRERLMNLVALLLSSREPVPFREIVGRVVGYDDVAGEEALEKRFDRDKADLRRLGIPVEYVTGEDGPKAGYVIPRDQVFQQRVSFTPQESMLLAIAGRVGAAATGGGALEEALKSALRKLAVDLLDSDPGSEIGDVTVLRASSGDPGALDNVTELAQAVLASRPVRFSYRAVETGVETERTADPYGIGLVRGAWYLVGRCHLREDVRVFKVSRIIGQAAIVPAADGRSAFQVPPGFRIEDHLAREVWDFGSAEPQRVRLSASHRAGVEQRFAAAEVVERGPETVVVDVVVRRPEALVDWVLSRAGEVTVVEPASLRHEVDARASALLERYRASERSLPFRAAVIPARAPRVASEEAMS